MQMNEQNVPMDKNEDITDREEMEECDRGCAIKSKADKLLIFEAYRHLTRLNV